MLNKKALAATAGGAEPLYVEDVFSTYLYTGNDSTQTITNGIDLSGEGGLVWLKKRAAVSPDTYTTDNHYLFDSERSANALISNDTTGQVSWSGLFTGFTSTGFGLNTSAHELNASASLYASWTFRKAEKFFDVVTYTGNGTSQTINHNLGSVPGCIIVKSTSAVNDWRVYHRSLATVDSALRLNSTAAAGSSSAFWNSTAPTSTQFTVGSGSSVNTNGATYVAYLFAHDAGGFGESGSDNVISCGSYTGNGTTLGPQVDLGWEPQFVIIKRSDDIGNWVMFDNMRGVATGGNDAYVLANLTNAEASANLIQFNATGFRTESGTTINDTSATYIYIAIRRGPMKTPDDATKVFQPVVYTGTNADNRLVDTTIAPDMVMVRQRNDTVLGGMVVGDRLRGNPYFRTGGSNAEVNDADSFMTPTLGYGNAFSAMNGFGCGNDATSKLNQSTVTNNQIVETFKRAPGFFDVVCYTGTGVARTVTHNLGVAPELIIVKVRNTAASWAVYSSSVGNTKWLVLNGDLAAITDSGTWNNTSPTSSVFTVGVNGEVNLNNNTYVAYLFATLPGISKVGSYTGNGSSQTINCEFTAGARFVLIKRTDSTGDWVVFDSARGIVSGNDPYLELNTTDAEVTDKDAVDTDNTGFVVNETTGPNINTNSATYIYLAIA